MLSIIICTYNRPELLKGCLSGAMQLLDEVDSEIIVVNDSKTHTPVVPEHPKLKLLNNPKQGVASARNFGARHATGNLLLFIDDDIEFDLKNAEALLEVYEKNEPACYNPNWRYSDEMHAALDKTQFGRFLIHYKLINYKGWVPELPWTDTLFEVKQLAAFFMLVPKRFFDAVSGFNESFTNQGTEDDELCHRLREAGVKMFVDPSNYVFHNEMDRVTLEARISRYRNGAVNRRKAFDLGNKSYEVKYSTAKKMILQLILPFEKVLFVMAKLIPNRRVFDPLYFKLANVLIATAIFGGYTKKS
jgi:GT2 family glycosyltransferase